ncbi:MAG: tripartite tricarboxylate transporter TctB family protein [Jannaschia sp.]
MTDTPDQTPPAEMTEAREQRGRLFALEICFLAFIGIFVAGAFLEATTYKIVSSRTPFVIMVPLMILIVIHAARLWRIRAEFSPGRRISAALRGQTPNVNKIVAFSGWMLGMLVIITVFGHFVGIFVFCVVLMRFLEAESWKLTLMVAAATCVFLFGVFEIAFNIDLYRGLIPRWFLGYRDF